MKVPQAEDQKKSNPFELGVQKVIPAVLVYILCESQVLMIHRNARSSSKPDFHTGKWNGLGGKCELGESPLEAAQREIAEESGFQLELSQFKPLGTILFPNFKPAKKEDWCVFVFYAEIQSQLAKISLNKSEEGELYWIPKDELLTLNLWPGDVLFIPHVLKKEPFMGTIWYENSQVKKHWITRLES